MDYVILLHNDEKEWDELPADEQRRIVTGIGEVKQAMRDAGVFRYSTPLAFSPHATVVRPGGLVTEGPFTEAREQLGGIFVVDCADRDEAVGWAMRFPTTSSDALEIRPAGAHQPG
jgi:hypothetical protein